eukprot:15431833-Alexandrium_andersonii.AAC.1
MLPSPGDVVRLLPEQNLAASGPHVIFGARCMKAMNKALNGPSVDARVGVRVGVGELAVGDRVYMIMDTNYSSSELLACSVASVDTGSAVAVAKILSPCLFQSSATLFGTYHGVVSGVGQLVATKHTLAWTFSEQNGLHARVG